jgi:transposase-like protein
VAVTSGCIWLRAYDEGMRCAQRGGYTPAEQQRRERLRLEAAGRFARGDKVSEIAHDRRVTEGSVQRWHRAWREGGTEALRSKGPVSRERPSPQQWAGWRPSCGKARWRTGSL